MVELRKANPVKLTYALAVVALLATAFVGPHGAHAVSNVGNGTGSELATYIVEKGKPLITPSATAFKEPT